MIPGIDYIGVGCSALIVSPILWIAINYVAKIIGGVPRNMELEKITQITAEPIEVYLKLQKNY
jgi:hypothetical protein